MSEVQEYKRKSIVPGYLPDEPLGVCEGAVRNERILFERGANQIRARSYVKCTMLTPTRNITDVLSQLSSLSTSTIVSQHRHPNYRPRGSQVFPIGRKLEMAHKSLMCREILGRIQNLQFRNQSSDPRAKNRLHRLLPIGLFALASGGRRRCSLTSWGRRPQLHE